jgi:hypothetical protein
MPEIRNRSSPLSDSVHHPAGSAERSCAAWSGGRPVDPSRSSAITVMAAAKPFWNPPSLARLPCAAAQGVALTPGSSGPGLSHLPVNAPAYDQRTVGKTALSRLP